MVVGNRRTQGGNGADALLIGIDAFDRNEGSVVDADTTKSDPAPIALIGPVTHCPAGDCKQSPRAGNAMVNPFKSAKFLDVEMDQPAWFLVIIAPDGLGWDEVAQPR